MFYYMHNNNNYQCKMLEQGPDFWCSFYITRFSCHCVHPMHAKMFSIQMLLHFSQIVPRVCTLVLFIVYRTQESTYMYSRYTKSFSKLSPTVYMTIYKSTNLQAVNIKTLKSHVCLSIISHCLHDNLQIYKFTSS